MQVCSTAWECVRMIRCANSQELTHELDGEECDAMTSRRENDKD